MGKVWRGAAVAAIFSLTSLLAVETPADLAKVAGYAGTAPNSARAFSFVVMGDNTGGHDPGRWARAVELVNRLRPDFVVSVGDLIEGYTDQPDTVKAQWDEFEAENAKLTCPFFYVAGNHDTTNPVMYDLYLKRHGTAGRAYYSFDYRGCHFVVLAVNDGILKPELLDEQLKWLDGDLAAAKGAEHTFVVFHRPAYDQKDFWAGLTKRLDPAKTTIINGHWHQMSYDLQDGLPVYVMGCTGAKTDAAEPGTERLLMQVSVDHGQPKLTVAPADDMRGAEALTRTALAKLDELCRLAVSPVTQGGGPVKVSLTNPMDREAVVEISASGADWTLTPPSATATLPPGGAQTVTLQAKPTRPSPAPFDLKGTFTYPGVKRTVSMRISEALPLALPRVEGLVVDGKLADWATVQPHDLADRSMVYYNPQNWSGPADHSVKLYAAQDGTRLFIAADVTDDQIQTDGAQSWLNDGLEFFWDARPAADRDGGHGRGSGQVILALTGQGDGLRPDWYVGDRPRPAGLVAAVSRKDGGYVIEMSMPIAELRSGVADSDQLALDFQFNDRDKVGAGYANSSVSLCRHGGHSRYTSDYFIAKLR